MMVHGLFHDYPRFWLRRGVLAQLFRPVAGLYALAGVLRQQFVQSLSVDVPVVCVGNVSIGGVGKTPVVSALAQALIKEGIKVHILCHGYKAEVAAPHRVVPARDEPRMVGDEALLLAAVAPTWIGKDRHRTAQMAEDAGAELILLDDGWQDPRLEKNFLLAVLQAENPFGNGFLLPAGPLRQRPDCLGEVDGIVAIGERIHPAIIDFSPLHAKRCVHLRGDPLPTGTEIFAFCGLGRSGQFHESVAGFCRDQQWRLRGFQAFPDHQSWDEKTLSRLYARAEGAVMVTSAKDYVRLPCEWQEKIRVLELTLVWQDPQAFSDLVVKLASLPKG